MAGEKFVYNPMEWGKIISNLLESPELTDIEIRPKSNAEDGYAFTMWVVEKNKGRYRLDLSQFPKEDVDYLAKNISVIPTQLAHRMNVNYNEGETILDAESTYKDKAILRVNVIHQAITGSELTPLIAIRKANYGLGINREQLLNSNYCTAEFFDLMETLIQVNCNVIIAGKVGSGKTTLLKYLVQYIPDNESIITVEDTREAFLELIYPNKEIGSLKSTKEVGFEKLINSCLRENMDWLLVSEIRSGTKEFSPIIDALEAVSTSSNLITTIHADSVEKIPYRMVNMAKADSSESTRIYNQIFYDINIGIHINYYNDKYGSHRKLDQVCEYYTDEKNKKQTHMIYWYDYKEGVYKKDAIKSPDILDKIIKKPSIDTSKIKGTFLVPEEQENNNG